MQPHELEALYRTWPDDKLLHLHQKSDEYSQAVQKALHKVMAERNLQPRSSSIPADAPSGPYMQSAILGPNGRVVRIVMFIIATSVGAIWGCGAYAGAPKTWNLALGIVTLFSLILGIVYTVKARASFWFGNEFGRDIFRLQHGNNSFEVEAPFNYQLFYTETEHRYKFATATVPTLGLVLTNRYGESIALLGNLSALDSPPPGWPHLSQVSLPADVRKYTEILLNRVNIERLKGWLDEANDKLAR